MPNMVIGVENDGEVLLLDDGLRRRVRAEDIPTACTWLPSEKVEVTERADGLHEIKRLSDGRSVLATPE